MPRLTPSQARTNRLNRQTRRRALVAKRAAGRAAHRNERATVASHLRAMGADETTASGMAATLRKKITGRGIKGYAKKGGTRRSCTRYTRAQVLAALIDYKPRKDVYKTTRTHLLALAA